MTDVSQIAREEGSKFEKQLYNTLKENLSDGFTIKQEKDIKREYGNDTSGIDILITNNSPEGTYTPLHGYSHKVTYTPKGYKYIFIQQKWKCKPESIKDIHHFIQGCNRIIEQKSLDKNSILHIYGTKVPISKPSSEALGKLNMSENITFTNMTTCILAITNKCLEFFNKIKIESNDLIIVPKERIRPYKAKNVIIPQINNDIFYRTINNKEYILRKIYGINIFTQFKEGIKNKTEDEIIKEAIEKNICFITKAGPDAQWYLKNSNKDIDKVKQKLTEPFNGYCPKGLYNILIELKV
jgi:hypothetical protein